MNWNSEWVDRACDPTKRRARLIVEVSGFSLMCAITLLLLGYFLYYYTAHALVVFGCVVVVSVFQGFVEWIIDDGCQEEVE